MVRDLRKSNDADRDQDQKYDNSTFHIDPRSRLLDRRDRPRLLQHRIVLLRPALLLPESGKAFISFPDIVVHSPNNFRGAFRTRIEWAAIGFAEMIGTRHQTFKFRTMPHREHVTGLMHRDF